MVGNQSRFPLVVPNLRVFFFLRDVSLSEESAQVPPRVIEPLSRSCSVKDSANSSS